MNLIAAWSAILLGLASGLVMGLFFHRENWLGGYDSFKRRMYRLGHISFFGLGTLNLLFYLTAPLLPPGHFLTLASWTFVVGAASMPICCALMAHFPRARLLFAIPVINLLIAGTVTLVEVIK